MLSTSGAALILAITLTGGQPPALESVFLPLKWSAEVEDLRDVFPGASIEVVRQHDPERTLALVADARTSALGDVGLVVEADARGRVHLIRYSSEDRRAECRLQGRAPEDVSAGVDCGWRRGRKALGTLDRWARLVRDVAGPPSTVEKPPNGEVHMKWQRRTHDIFLALARNEDGLWEISLTAVRASR